MTPEIWLRLAGRVNELLAKPEIVGIVVTPRTDTLEETAYFLDLHDGGVKPVILVGAQRPRVDRTRTSAYCDRFGVQSL